ncbi:hypothetical protein [Nostoc sp. FACHB-280]|uniref:hypothetical protein n=1 Tax=Nostoc sp. FACHB-280 TaxID=2692839 RepID=UPI00168B18DD|nr:hypothetical protein [Nostoc sp. FACHB-280]MBD2497694.1 hypothetical protein [Nostoc sp. FACHB-280]
MWHDLKYPCVIFSEGVTDFSWRGCTNAFFQVAATLLFYYFWIVKISRIILQELILLIKLAIALKPFIGN